MNRGCKLDRIFWLHIQSLRRNGSEVGAEDCYDFSPKYILLIPPDVRIRFRKTFLRSRFRESILDSRCIQLRVVAPSSVWLIIQSDPSRSVKLRRNSWNSKSSISPSRLVASQTPSSDNPEWAYFQNRLNKKYMLPHVINIPRNIDQNASTGRQVNSKKETKRMPVNSWVNWHQTRHFNHVQASSSSSISLLEVRLFSSTKHSSRFMEASAWKSTMVPILCVLSKTVKGLRTESKGY